MYNIENKAELCPICNGSGKYKQTWNYGTSAECSTETLCHRLWW